MKLPVLQYPDPRLGQKSEPIVEITDEIRELAKNMLETMYEDEGIGLAAPQVGELVRMIVVDVSWPERIQKEKSASQDEISELGMKPETELGTELANDGMPLILINPKLELAGKTIKSEEGCLSVPNDYRANVPRKEIVYLKALDLDGNEVAFEADGILAICLQHEVDHLDGKLFIDYISRLKLGLYKSSLKKNQK